MSAEPKPDLRLEIAHLLLIDVVGYSKLLVNEQIELIQELNRIVRNTPSFRDAEATGKLLRLPTGDGMALLFFRSLEEPAQCALEIGQELRNQPHVRVRMGVHSGPVNQVQDVNDRSNIAGAGINIAQRVMDCGDAGHILLSKHVADDLAQYRHWRPYLHDLGECEVKHGLRLHIVNLHKEGVGNPERPQKLRHRHRWKQGLTTTVRPLSGWPRLTMLAALLLSAVALLVLALLFLRHPIAPASKSIAVLPFENLSDDQQNTYFADAVLDEILTNLSKVAELKVISRTSVMQYRAGAPRNIREVAQNLGVAHILEGTVQRVGDHVRVNAQLINARTDAHIWAEHYDRDIADVFALESELAQTIAAQLKARLAPEEKAAMEKRPTGDLDAFDLYVRARTLLASSTYTGGKQNRLEAARLLDQAILRDPTFFLAHCQLARVHSEIYLLGMDHTPARLAFAEVALKGAQRLRPGAAETHLALAYYFYCGYLDYDHAGQELDIAKQALPNEPLVFELAGYIDRRRGRWEDSARNLGHALDLDPLNFDFLQQVASSYSKLRDFPKVAATLDRALALKPDDAGVREKRAAVDLDWRADTKPLHRTLEAIVAERPALAVSLADDLVDLALWERDYPAAERALAMMPSQGAGLEGFSFPKAWYQGLIARERNDTAAARNAFTQAYAEVDKVVREQPDYAEALCVLGLIDAGLDNKESAIQKGQRAVELLPLSKDAINGALAIEYLSVIYAWVGDKEHALKHLSVAASIPSNVSYGELKLSPFWDSLRGDPAFEKIVDALAPK
jgi:TolB-like protein/class 3 adenylate cyclase/Tfp pilus assembly protein PilF